MIRKIVNINRIDQYNLEDFLNRMARNGYHFKKFNVYSLLFEYEPELSQNYTVVLNQFDFLFKNDEDVQDEQRFNDLVDEFDYRLIDKSSILSVYSSGNYSSFYSDE